MASHGTEIVEVLTDVPQVFLLRRAIELLHAFVRENVHPLTAATFSDWFEPKLTIINLEQSE